VADRYFVGDTDSDWNDASNWAASSGGAGGAGVPGSADKAILDGNSPDCTCDVAPEVNELELQAGFGNTLDLNGYALTVGSGGFSQAGGTFNGSTQTITLNGDFTLTGGTFNATSGTLDASLDNLVSTFSGGTFNHSSGLYKMGGGTLDINVAVSFYDFELAKQGADIFFDITGGSWDVAGDFTLTNAGNLTMTPTNTAMTLAGDWHGNDSYVPVSSSWIIEFDGTGAQSVDGGYDIPGVKINKASGTLSFNSDISVRSSSWEWVQGTVDYKTFKVIFAAGVSINSAWLGPVARPKGLLRRASLGAATLMLVYR
jgi:hypothetical protein